MSSQIAVSGAGNVSRVVRSSALRRESLILSGRNIVCTAETVMKTALFMQFRNEAANESNGKKDFLNQSIAQGAAEASVWRYRQCCKLTASRLLASCYRSCLELAERNRINSIAFCCISTGEFHFPNGRAAEIAMQTVTELLAQKQSEMKVIFNVFKDLDYEIYKKLLRTN